MLAEAGEEDQFLGFAIVAVSNAFWRDSFAATPFGRRLLLLPHCMRRQAQCRGRYHDGELSCAGCGACDIERILRRAHELGYEVRVAEGTPVTLRLLISGACDAVLGVACMDSLEQAFRYVRQAGIPNLGVPLLVDGCEDTQADTDRILEYLELRSDTESPPSLETRPRSYLPLLRMGEDLFAAGTLESLLKQARVPGRDAAADPTYGEALTWLREGGKRFRPFMVLAAHAALRPLPEAFRERMPVLDTFGAGTCMLAVAVEALHKASLAHDDIADSDLFRYGRPTLHHRLGIGPALNIGDLLIGAGYRLLQTGALELGGDTALRLLDALSLAHVRLCRGQGCELSWTGTGASPTPLEVLRIYALKTSPGFAIALLAGAAAAGMDEAMADTIQRFSRDFGVAYQIRNDLDDLFSFSDDKRVSGQDSLAGRPTLLRAFARQLGAAAEEEEAVLRAVAAGNVMSEARLDALRTFYENCGAWERCRELCDRYRDRALECAAACPSPEFGRFLSFVVDVILT
jgi:geranylgeranyl pyrophosphate synthase